MAVASVWRRAWMRSRGSGEDVTDSGGRSLHPTGDNSTTAGTIYTSSTITATSSMAPPTSPVVEENEELKEDMAVASAWPWRRAWVRQRGGGEHDADDRGCSLPPTGGHSTTSGTTYTTSTTTATSGSAGEPRLRDLHPFPSTAPVVEENAAEELDVAKDLAKEKAKKLEHIKGLVEEFRGDDRSALERWLSELDAGWVLHLAGTHESSAGVVTSHGFQFLIESWILALRKISESILTSLDGWYSQRQDHDEGTNKQPSTSEFAELAQAAVLMMLPFVVIAVAAKTTDRPGALALALAPAEKLQALIDMHGALSMASQNILSLQVESTDEGKMGLGDLLSAYLTKLDEAIWATIVEIMNIVMAWTWTDDCGSSDIHKVTKSIVSYTKVLWANYSLVNRILDDAVLRGEFVSENENVSHVSNLIMEMVSSLEITPSSRAFPNESLRFLFLINNLYYLLQQFLTVWRLDFTINRKIDDHINSYLHVSWAPVLNCLQDHATPCCFGRPRYSPLPKFESEFQKTYKTQKLWKVPDPQMRRKLQKAIIDNVIPVFTQYLEDNSISTTFHKAFYISKNNISTQTILTPRKAEKMLGKLFEG